MLLWNVAVDRVKDLGSRLGANCSGCSCRGVSSVSCSPGGMYSKSRPRTAVAAAGTEYEHRHYRSNSHRSAVWQLRVEGLMSRQHAISKETALGPAAAAAKVMRRCR